MELIHRVGPPKFKPAEGEKWDASMSFCACAKWVPNSNMRILDTGFIKVIDNTCPGCREAVRGLSILVCTRCRAVVARLEPHKDAKSGFVYAPGKCYHLDCCSTCEPDIVVKQKEPTFIIEMLMHFKRNNIPIPDRWKNRKYQKPLFLGAK